MSLTEETREQQMVQSLKSVDKRDPLTEKKATINTRDLALRAVKMVVVDLAAVAVEDVAVVAVVAALAMTVLHRIVVVAVVDVAAVVVDVAAVVAVVEVLAAIVLHQAVVVAVDLAEAVEAATKQQNNCNIYIQQKLILERIKII